MNFESEGIPRYIAKKVQIEIFKTKIASKKNHIKSQFIHSKSLSKKEQPNQFSITVV